MGRSRVTGRRDGKESLLRQGLEPLQENAAAFETGLRPERIAVVELGDGGCVRRKNDPRLPGGGEDVDVRWQAIGFEERSNSDEMHRLT